MGIVTPDEIWRVSQPFERSHADLSNREQLVLAITRKFIPLIGVAKRGDERKLIIIAAVFKVLTRKRSFKEAREYLSSEKGVEWGKFQ